MTSALITLLALQGAAAEPTDVRLLRFPAVHGETVVFTYANDLWVTKLDGGIARRLTSHPGSEARAKISPDGKWVGFTATYDGNPDIYVMPVEGGEPQRLTFEPEPDLMAGWTPDGRLAYTSSAGNFTPRQERLWTVRPTGGLPQRTVLDEVAELSYSPDGKQLAYQRADSNFFNWRRYRGGTQGRISFFEFATNRYWSIPAKDEQNYHPMWVGNSVFFTSDRNLGTLNLYRYDVDSKRITQLTRFNDSDIRMPNTDGKTIVYERDGYLWAYDIASGNVKKVEPRILGDRVTARPYWRRLDAQITGMTLSPSANRVAVEARGELFSLPARSGETRNFTQSSASRERWPRWSPDGQTIAYASDATGNYEIYIQPQRGGDATKLTDAKLPINNLNWAPNSKMIAFTTEGNEVYTLDVATKKLTRVFKARFGVGPFDWSPDSKWIAYSDQRPNGLGMIHLYEVATGKTTAIGSGMYDDSNPVFDQNGRFLYFTSFRTFNPSFGAFEFSLKVEDGTRMYVLPLQKGAANPLLAPGDEEPEAPPAPPAGGPPAGAPPAGAPPAGARPGGAGGPGAPGGPGAGRPAGPPPAPEVKIDFDGIGNRALPLPQPAGNYALIAGMNNGVLFWSGGNLTQFDLNSRQPIPIAQGVPPSIVLNANRTKMAYYLGGVLGIVDVRPGFQLGQGRVETAGVEAMVVPRDEWRQIYWEAWRFLRDNFYDPQMLGLDWKRIGDHYAQFLPHVAHRSDLNYVLGLMVGELGTGHSYVSGGDMGPMPAPVPVGALGADYEVVGDNVRFLRIYRGFNYDEGARGPLGEPGVDVRDGDFLLAIDGRPVNAGVHPNSLLTNKVGRTVILTVNDKPTREGARTVRVRPIGNEAELRYETFVDDNRRWVAEKSGGRIGYMHVPDTATSGAIGLLRGFYSQTDKEAMVVDERWNGGGFIQPWFVDTLSRRIRAGIQQRNAATTEDAPAIEGPMVLLINQYAGSGGDFFPWIFRQQGRGKLIGMRTWGGLVGISGGAPLIDGGSVTAPEFGLFDRETGQWIAENTGVAPDIEVDRRPDLIAQGRDPQLEKAVEVLLEELKRNPRKPVKVPAFPRPKVGG